MTGFLRASSLVAHREVRAARNDPGPYLVLPALPPLLMLLVFVALFDRIAGVAGLGELDYAAYLAPGVGILVALLGAGATSSTLAADVRGGYLERLRLMPFNLAAVLAGRLAVEALRLVPAVLVVLATAFLLGARDVNHGLGVVTVIVLVVLLGTAYSGLFLAVAALTADPQTPFTLQPMGLPLAFLSTALVPLSVMPPWAEALASANPVTVVVDGARTAMLGDVVSGEVATALALLTGCVVASTLLAHVALARAVERGWAG